MCSEYFAVIEEAVFSFDFWVWEDFCLGRAVLRGRFLSSFFSSSFFFFKFNCVAVFVATVVMMLHTCHCPKSVPVVSFHVTPISTTCGCGSKRMGSHFRIGEFTIHFRTYFSGWIGD